jgi:two-component system, NtrC family, sensor kinase
VKLIAKFLLAFLVTSLVVLALSGYFRVEREIEHFDADLQKDAGTYATSLAHAAGVLIANVGQQEAAELVQRAAEPAHDLAVRWVALEPNAPDFEHPLVPLAELGHIDQGVVFRSVPPTPASAGSLIAYAALTQPVPGVGRTAIEVNESMAVRDRFVRGSVHRTALSMAIALAATVGVAFILGVSLVGRPLRATALKVRRVGAGDLSGPLSLEQKDEIGEVARELDAMCERLGEKQRKLEAETSARIAVLEQLRHADRLATVGGLASGIAHEIGTPLAVVLGRGKMIAAGEVSGEEARDNARIVVEQTQRISKIIRQLLDFARPRPAQKGRVDLVPIANKTAALLEPMAGKRGVSIRVRAPAAGSLHALVDAGHIEQSLTNLLVNAIQATPRGGQIEVTLGRERVAAPAPPAASPGPFIVLSVTDTGAGMDRHTVEHVFEPFYPTKEVGEGTGLGLSVAYGLVRDHGGWIEVQSAPGKGSTFSILLPDAAQPGDRAAFAPAEARA